MNALANTLDSRRTLGVLVLANAALVALLALFSSPRAAQATGSSGDYAMVVGQSMGAVPETVYVVDTRSGKAYALAFNGGNRVFEKFSTQRDISKDANQAEKNGSTKSHDR